jgi:putative ABC transport system permease protein
VGLSVAVATAADSAERTFDSLRDASRSYDLLIGPPQGSPLQIVLVTLFHVDKMQGTFPWSVYEDFRKDPRVASAVPYAVGDSFAHSGRAYRVVGTSREMFDVLHGADGLPLGERVRGSLFTEGNFEAVVGSLVAEQTGLRIGDEFHLTHGVEKLAEEHTENWKVVGVMRPTGSPHDRAIFIPIDTFFRIEGHEHVEHGNDAHGDHEGAGEPPGGAHDGEPDASHDEHAGRRLSAIGLRLKTAGLMKLRMFGEIRKDRTDVQAAMPEDQVRALKEIVGDLHRAFRGVAWLVLAVVLLGILVSLYNTIQGRRREIAVLRALGARPRHVFSVIVLEAVLLCLAGGLLGILLGRGGAHAVAPMLQATYGIRLDASPRLFDLQVLASVVVLGALAGIVPAWRGLRTPVAPNLHPSE